VALTLGMQRRLDAGGAGVRCFAVDPGEVLTDITRTLPPPLRSMYRALLPWILFTPAQGAAQPQTQQLSACLETQIISGSATG
jgi:NAD(P)-dependent dehydrogenase (short-subunit alcohol dehydrogenase family)